MTTCDDITAAPCSCESCTADLPVNPFLALRVAYGMLLGEDDFRAMMGNPRGKHVLYAAWQHGSGVVRGYCVLVEGTWDVKVAPGLAVDGLGRGPPGTANDGHEPSSLSQPHHEPGD